jgi:hypothetical protein
MLSQARAPVKSVPTNPYRQPVPGNPARAPRPLFAGESPHRQKPVSASGATPGGAAGFSRIVVEGGATWPLNGGVASTAIVSFAGSAAVLALGTKGSFAGSPRPRTRSR